MAQDYFHHVRDFPFFELPLGLGVDLTKHFSFDPHVHVSPGATGIPLPGIDIGGHHHYLSKFMVLQVIAGVLTLLIFKGLSKRVRSGEPTSGRFWNFWESIALFVRDEVVRPTIGDGHHDHGDDHGHGESHGGGHAAEAAVAGHHADQYLPFVWTCFFYILFWGRDVCLWSNFDHLLVTLLFYSVVCFIKLFMFYQLLLCCFY